MIELKDVSDIFPDGNVWGVSTFTYDEKELGFKLSGGTLHPIECKDDLLEIMETLLLDNSVDKILVKARGKFLKDLNKSAVVYSKVKGDFKVLPKVGESVRYKDFDLNNAEIYLVLAIDLDCDNVVVKHTYKSFGDQVSYFGIPFSEYFKDMEVVNDQGVF